MSVLNYVENSNSASNREGVEVSIALSDLK